MLDTLVASEGEPDLLQISGGEPTHPSPDPRDPAAGEAATDPPSHAEHQWRAPRANEPAFVEALAELGPGFEVYLQFDSLRKEALENIRGADLRSVREPRSGQSREGRASPRPWSCVVKKGVNDQEIGEIARHALEYECVRGITFQPVQDAGRNLDFDKNRDRAMLTDIRRVIAETSRRLRRGGSAAAALQSRGASPSAMACATAGM